MCLCGIMSAEFDDLPPQVRREIDQLPRMNVTWIARVLALAKPGASGQSLNAQAMAIFAVIAGAQLMARGAQDFTVYDRAVRTYRATGLIP
jgi:TetR/AcrR family transcriptional regulator, transcriptional repressor for nem operon